MKRIFYAAFILSASLNAEEVAAVQNGQAAGEGSAAGKNKSVWGPVLFATGAAAIAAAAIIVGINSTKAPHVSTSHAH